MPTSTFSCKRQTNCSTPFSASSRDCRYVEKKKALHTGSSKSFVKKYVYKNILSSLIYKIRENYQAYIVADFNSQYGGLV